MRAILMRETGGPEVLRPEEIPAPEPGPGEVLLRTEAVGVGYYETLMRSGTFPVPVPLPAVFGFEAAGTVADLGEGVDGALAGTRALAMNLDAMGAYAEYVVAPVDALTPLPDEVSAADAVAVAVPGSVALCLLRTAGPTGTESVLVEVASGSVGGSLARLARAHGAARIVATAGGPAKVEQVRRLGVDAVLDHNDPDWTDRVPDALGGRGLDIAFESIGGASAGRLLDTLTPGSGRMLLYGVLTGEPAVTPMDLLRRGLTLVGCGGTTAWADRVRAARADVLGLVAEGVLRPRIDRVLPLAEAAAAHRRVEDRLAVGRIVLTP